MPQVNLTDEELDMILHHIHFAKIECMNRHHLYKEIISPVSEGDKQHVKEKKEMYSHNQTILHSIISKLNIAKKPTNKNWFQWR